MSELNFSVVGKAICLPRTGARFNAPAALL
jgi:hypothetical protein